MNSLWYLVDEVKHDIPTQPLQDHRYFYHLAPKNAVYSPRVGIITPQYMYDHKMYDLFDKSTAKYRDRIVNGWGIFPDKDPDKLTREEVIAAIKMFRRDESNGLNKIYFFKYPPTKKLGPNMRKTLAGKRIFRIDLDNPKVKKWIGEIDWGYDGSHTDSKPLDESYYLNVTPAEYFRKYNDKAKMSFAALNHIGITAPYGHIPLDCFDEIDVE